MWIHASAAPILCFVGCTYMMSSGSFGHTVMHFGVCVCMLLHLLFSPTLFFFAKISSFVKSCFSFQVLGCRSVAGLCTVWCGDSLAFFAPGTCHVSTDRRCTAVGSMIPDSGPLYRLLGGLRFMRHNGGRTVSVET